jgi:riboflavin synthase
MFTGLIESEGIITRAERIAGGMRIEVYAPDFGRDMAIGDSVAIDGVCLTITKFIRGAFLADVSDETVRRTTLGSLRQGGKVNLERALRFSDRLGGHIVSGHIDGVGKLVNRHAAGNSTIYRFAISPDLRDFIVEKGSIAVDGISLTVMEVTTDGFTTAVIPHTEEITTLKDKQIGGGVNIEVDLMAKYVRRYVMRYMGVDDDGPSSKEAPRRGLGDLLRDLTDGK